MLSPLASSPLTAQPILEILLLLWVMLLLRMMLSQLPSVTKQQQQQQMTTSTMMMYILWSLPTAMTVSSIQPGHNWQQ
jgi:hypothetical protein